MTRANPPAGLSAILALLLMAGCARQSSTSGSLSGQLEVLDPGLEALVDPGAEVEILADGYQWTEGPVWVAEEGMLLFSDTQTNTVYQWKEGTEASPWLSPSGYTGDAPRGGGLGSNGLTMDAAGSLVLCQHGDRRVAWMDASITRPQPVFETVADSWQGRRFNSPNDLAIAADGAIYFTDPPYGLDSPESAEIPFSGVYRVGEGGAVTLLDSTLTRPNGIAFSPDGSRLYVANSDPQRALWMAYDVAQDGSVRNGRVFHDATASVGPENPGLPDGLKVDVNGNVFATGPGGVWVLSPEGSHLGTIRTEVATSNVAFGGVDRKTLFLTSSSRLARIQTQTTGL